MEVRNTVLRGLLWWICRHLRRGQTRHLWETGRADMARAGLAEHLGVGHQDVEDLGDVLGAVVSGNVSQTKYALLTLRPLEVTGPAPNPSVPPRPRSLTLPMQPVHK